MTKKVSFDLTPTIHIIPSRTEEEKAQAQEERWTLAATVFHFEDLKIEDEP